MGYKYENIKFEFTDDNSVGLFDVTVSDIYHSRSGALKEAYEKFINPVITSGIEFEDNISILDICYGVGYNTKAAMKSFCNYKINIDAMEYYDELIILSPFIKDNINDISLNAFLLNKIIEYVTDIDLINNFYDYSSKNVMPEFFNDLYDHLIDFLKLRGYTNIPQGLLIEFLHNIYYNYISNSMLYGSNYNKYNKCNFRYYRGDARDNVKSLDSKYDIVFLDAFSSKKDPTLWTIDFLSQIKNVIKKNSVLVSYSKSTPFRSALLELGFFVGKTLINDIDMGTICSLNSNFIVNPLDNFDLKIISSRSGIPYRDSNLNLSAEKILLDREFEVNNSNRISRTQLTKFINL